MPLYFLCIMLGFGNALQARSDFVYNDHAGQLPKKFFEVPPESQIGNIFKTVLLRSPNRLVLDIGMNAGYFTLLSASMNATVYSFEPQLTCIERMHEHLASNPGFARLTHIHNFGLGSVSLIRVPKRRDCDGGFGAQGFHTHSHSTTFNFVPIVNPELVWQPDWHVSLIKIDTEGGEADMLRHFEQFVAAGRIDNIVVEIAPHVWHLRGIDRRAEGISLFKRLESHAKNTYLLHDEYEYKCAKAPVHLPGFTGKMFGNFSVEELLSENKAANVWFEFR